MIPPASAIAISSSTVVGYMAKATSAAPLSTSRISSAGPRMPPTKSMRLSVRGSPIAEERREDVHPAAAARRATPPDRATGCASSVERVPAPREIHRASTLARRVGPPGSTGRRVAQLGEKHVGRPARRDPSRRGDTAGSASRNRGRRRRGTTTLPSFPGRGRRHRRHGRRPGRGPPPDARRRARRSPRDGGRRRCRAPGRAANAATIASPAAGSRPPDRVLDAVGRREAVERGAVGHARDQARRSTRRAGRSAGRGRFAPASRRCGASDRSPCPAASSRAS